MASDLYDIEVSNGMKISVELPSATGVLKLHITFPVSGKRVTFSHDPNGPRPKGQVDDGGLGSVRMPDDIRPGRPATSTRAATPTTPKWISRITDTGGSGLMLTYGDPKDPHMP